MTVECPNTACDTTSKSGRGIAVHWSRSHEKSLKDEYPDFDCSSTEEHKRNVSEALTGNTLPEEHRKNIAEARRGVSTMTEEGKEYHRQRMKGNTLAKGYERTEEQRQALEKGRTMSSNGAAISESMVGNTNWRQKHQYVEELGYSVASTWELHVAFYLEALDMEYEREPEYEKPDGGSYYPDFQIDNVVIEVKGYADEYSIEKAEMFLTEYPDLTYVVVGDEMPSDKHIPWDKRDQVLGTLGRNLMEHTVNV